MLSVGDNSQPDSSQSVIDSADVIENILTLSREGSNCYSASLPGEGNRTILIYGPLAMAEEIAGMLKRNQVGAKLYIGEGEQDVRELLTARDYDLFVYHASKRESAKGIKSERMPPSLEAVLLGYGIGCAYPESTIQRCKDEFKVQLLERLKDG